MRRELVLGALAFLLAWWGIARSSSEVKSAESASLAETKPEPSRATPKAPEVPESVEPVPPPLETPKPVLPTAIPFEFQSELNTYADLKAKVLPSEEEKSARELLLKNANLLRSVGARLMRTPLLPLGEQDIAIDLLFEALEKGDKSASAEALAAVVADGQVEDKKLPIPVREQLAGIKAEVLYHWMAVSPDQARRLGSLLPGPASRRIWENVKEAHSQNLQTSQYEASR